jgi:hypothetical protein
MNAVAIMPVQLKRHARLYSNRQAGTLSSRRGKLKFGFSAEAELALDPTVRSLMTDPASVKALRATRQTVNPTHLDVASTAATSP